MRYVGLDVSYRNVGVVILDHAACCLEAYHLKCTATNDLEGFEWHNAQAEQLFMPGDIVSIEGLSFGSIGRTHVLAGAHAIWLLHAKKAASLIAIPVPIRVKLWATGSAKATKQDMIAWATPTLGPVTTSKKVSEHEADALSLALIGYALDRALNSVPQHLTQYQLDILSNKKSTGLSQALDKSYYRGNNGS